VLAPLIPTPKLGGRPPQHARREIVNAIRYVLRGGIAWRTMPYDLPPWQTVSHDVRRRRLDGTGERANHELREQDAAARAAWWEQVTALNPATLVFLAETSTPTTLTRLRGRSLDGQRRVRTVPRGRWQAVSLLATLTPTGLGASLPLEGAIARPSFEVFFTEMLVPTLQSGQTVILDNRSVHKSVVDEVAIATAGLGVACSFCLPTHPISIRSSRPSVRSSRRCARPGHAPSPQVWRPRPQRTQRSPTRIPSPTTAPPGTTYDNRFSQRIGATEEREGNKLESELG
jgi:transposase